jgi:lactose/L-arabinose transport system substrate-binding protein
MPSGSTRLLRILMAVTALAIVATACGGDDSPDDAELSADTPAEELEADLEVWAWNVAAASLEDAVPGFNEQYPNVNVTVNDIGREDVYQRLIIGLEAGGEGLPDVSALESDRIATVYNSFPDGLTDLGQFGADEYQQDYEEGKWDDSVGPDGQVLAMPWDAGPVGVFYRHDVFEQAGVDAEAIETWDDYRAAGEQILDATGQRMFAMDATDSPRLLMALINQLGGFYFDDEGNIAVTSDEVVTAMTTLQEFYEAGIVENVNGWDGQVSANANEDVVAQFSGVWWSGTMLDQMPDQAGLWRAMQLPAFEPGGSQGANWGGSTLIVPAASENQEAAWRFVEYTMTDVDSQVMMLHEYGLFPAYTPAYEAPEFSQELDYFDDQAIFPLFADTVEEIEPVNYTSDFARAEQHMADAQARILLQGADPQAELQEVADLLASETGRDIAG